MNIKTVALIVAVLIAAAASATGVSVDGWPF